MDELLPNTDEIKPPAELWYEVLIRFGLYAGAVFQLICLLALFVRRSDEELPEEVSPSPSPADSKPTTASTSTITGRKQTKSEKKKRK